MRNLILIIVCTLLFVSCDLGSDSSNNITVTSEGGAADAAITDSANQNEVIARAECLVCEEDVQAEAVEAALWAEIFPYIKECMGMMLGFQCDPNTGTYGWNLADGDSSNTPPTNQDNDTTDATATTDTDQQTGQEITIDIRFNMYQDGVRKIEEGEEPSSVENWFYNQLNDLSLSDIDTTT